MNREPSGTYEVPWSLVDLIPPPDDALCRQLVRLLCSHDHEAYAASVTDHGTATSA